MGDMDFCGEPANQEYEHQIQLEREQELNEALDECVKRGISRRSLMVLARESGGMTWALRQSIKS